jgi:hypothetical protein
MYGGVGGAEPRGSPYPHPWPAAADAAGQQRRQLSGVHLPRLGRIGSAALDPLRPPPRIAAVDKNSTMGSGPGLPRSQELLVDHSLGA